MKQHNLQEWALWPRKVLALMLITLTLTGCFPFFTFERPPRVHEIGLADLTGNGYLDAYLAIGPGGEPYAHPDYVLFNQGNGRFLDSGQSLDNWDSRSVQLADLTGNGDIDAVVGHGGVSVYRNDGQGFFPFGQQTLSTVRGTGSLTVALGDLNGNDILDIFGAACCGGAIPQPNFQPLYADDLVWLGNGEGLFVRSSQQLAKTGSTAVALGDLNGNGFLDAFIASGLSINADGTTSSQTPNTVWFNDGQGNFSDSGQRLGQMESLAVALGDVNGNGFLDAVVGNRGPDEIWLNDGTGHFSDSGQRLNNGLTCVVFLADLNGNGYLDLVVAGETGAQVWLNNGTGRFHTGQSISYERDQTIALGDVTGDDLTDIFVAGVESYQVWRGQGNGRFVAGPPTDYR